jgi:hypothetical protein
MVYVHEDRKSRQKKAEDLRFVKYDVKQHDDVKSKQQNVLETHRA